MEGGLDVFSGETFLLSVTAFDQRAEGLIQHVVRGRRLAPLSVQQQNVGEISNRGGEVQGMLRTGPMTVEGSASSVTSVVRVLSRAYTGDLKAGDRLPEVPSWTGHLALSMQRGRLSGTAGVSVIGDWTGYDWVEYYSLLSIGAEAPASLRPFWINYPAIARSYFLIADAPTPGFNWFTRIDNIANRQRDTRDNLAITAGRTLSVGVNFTTP